MLKRLIKGFPSLREGTFRPNTGQWLTQHCLSALHENLAFLLICFFYIAGSLLVQRHLHVHLHYTRPFFSVFYRGIVLSSCIVFSLYALITYITALFKHPPSAVDTTWQHIKQLLQVDRLLNFGIACVMLPFVGLAQNRLKVLLPSIQAFRWDPFFRQLDQMLFLGHTPWMLLRRLFQHPWLIWSIDQAYLAWFPVSLGVFLWMAMAPAPGLRMRFLLSFVLTWLLLGCVAATFFASAGPCYYTMVIGHAAPEYAALLSALQQIHNHYQPLQALIIQGWLWQHHSTQSFYLGSGISAFPSLHVGTAALYALAASQQHRVIGALLWLFAGITLLGSVILGWHYAVDGLASGLAVWLLWVGVARWMQWMPPNR